MHAYVEVQLAGETIHLLADRALYWPAAEAVMIADLHLGKGNVFRSAGIPVPTGGTQHDLKRLSTLLVQTQAKALWILGDFLHGPHHDDVEQQWLAFRHSHAHIDMWLVPGNHDRNLVAERVDVLLAADGTIVGPFQLRHAPSDDDLSEKKSGSHVICGHVHPVLRLPGLGRHPLFWLRSQCTVLPAFSRFTGGWDIPPRQARGSAVCNGTHISVLDAGSNLSR